MSDKANWTELDVSQLPEHVRRNYEAYKAAYREMKDLRGIFEQSMADEVLGQDKIGKRVIFGYNFGKLSVAIVDDDRKPAKSSTPKLSLAEFMRQQAASGRAC